MDISITQNTKKQDGEKSGETHSSTALIKETEEKALMFKPKSSLARTPPATGSMVK